MKEFQVLKKNYNIKIKLRFEESYNIRRSTGGKNKEVNKKLNFHNHKCETCDRTTSIQKEGSYNPLGDILERSYNPLGDILHS
ncbi:hypothetical protein Anas_14203 [Armadillidium nasatum]|uniref:Uncharacterized protein n=1 Tax=Armadillidium nasatum TaxID=96803 RepID=A0A5N5T0J2_9CRUS|nr:hypothetical protein Anas_14203 [Armadillidium nasatum]